MNDVFGLGTFNGHTAKLWSKNFRRGDESLEVNKNNGMPSDVDKNQLRALVVAY